MIVNNLIRVVMHSVNSHCIDSLLFFCEISYFSNNVLVVLLISHFTNELTWVAEFQNIFILVLTSSSLNKYVFN